MFWVFQNTSFRFDCTVDKLYYIICSSSSFHKIDRVYSAMKFIAVDLIVH